MPTHTCGCCSGHLGHQRSSTCRPPTLKLRETPLGGELGGVTGCLQLDSLPAGGGTPVPTLCLLRQNPGQHHCPLFSMGPGTWCSPALTPPTLPSGRRIKKELELVLIWGSDMLLAPLLPVDCGCSAGCPGKGPFPEYVLFVPRFPLALGHTDAISP